MVILWAWSSYTANKHWIRGRFSSVALLIASFLRWYSYSRQCSQRRVIIFSPATSCSRRNISSLNSSSEMSDQVLSSNSSYKRRPGCRICAKNHMLLIFRYLVRNCSVFCGMAERYLRWVWIISDASKLMPERRLGSGLSFLCSSSSVSLKNRAEVSALSSPEDSFSSNASK